MKKLPVLMAVLLVTLGLSGCGSSSVVPTPSTSSTASSTTRETQKNSVHTVRDWLVNYVTYGAKYEKTIDFDAYEEAITATLGVPQSDSVWGIALYAEKGWRDGKPHRFYLQIGSSEMGGIGGSYSYKHYGPYTDNVLALVNEARGIKLDEMIAPDVQVISEIATASTSQR